MCSLYIAYGSNLHPERLRRRVSCAQILEAIELPGWRLAWHKKGRDGSAKCDLVRAAKRVECAHAVLYEIADPRDRQTLDAIEGVGCGYEVDWLELPRFGRAFFYRAQSTHVDSELRPFTWYRDLTLAGARYHRLPSQWVEKIESVEAWIDPDPRREREHRAILGTL